jgi:membrane protein
MTAKTAWSLLRRTASEFMDDRAMRLAAALAFYTALSIAPLLLVVVSVVGFAYGQEAAEGQLHAQLEDQLGPRAAETVQTLVAKSSPERGGGWAVIIGIVTLLVGATGVFSQLQDALNTVWDIEEHGAPPGGIWKMIRDRLLAFAMVCGAALLLLASLATSAVISGLGEFADEWLGIGAGWLRFADTAVSLAVTFGMFALIFRFLPFQRPRWSDVWIGAGVTTLLFAIGKYLIGLYLGRAAVGSTFGAAGSFVVLLMWLYYSSVIFLFGAEFTQVYARRDVSEKQRAGAAKHGDRTQTDRQTSGRSEWRSGPPSAVHSRLPATAQTVTQPLASAQVERDRPSLAHVLLLLVFALIPYLVGALRISQSRPDASRQGQASATGTQRNTR